MPVRCIALIAIVLVAQASAFAGLHEQLQERLTPVINHVLDKTRIEGAAAPQEHPSYNTLHLATKYRADSDKYHPSVDGDAEPRRGMSLVLGTESHCFLMGMERPGDSFLASFKYRSNLTETYPQLARNLSVDIFSPTFKTLATYSYLATDPRLAKKVSIRATPRSTDAASELHGVESGMYSVCFRNAKESMFGMLLARIMDASPAAELSELEILELEVIPAASRRAVADVRSSLAAERSSMVAPTTATTADKSGRPITAIAVRTIERRIEAISYLITEIALESKAMLDRREEADYLSNDTFTRTWIMSVLTMVIMGLVVAFEQKAVRDFLRKKKLV